jgi:hypothetical protein
VRSVATEWSIARVLSRAVRQVILTNRVSRITGTVTTDRGGAAKEYAIVMYGTIRAGGDR